MYIVGVSGAQGEDRVENQTENVRYEARNLLRYTRGEDS
jgi:hypothetical protein